MIARVALVAAIASEGLAFYTVAEWFAAGYLDGSHHAISGVAFVSIALIAFFFPRFLQTLELRPRVASALMGLVAYVTIYGLIRVQFAGDFAIWDLSWVVDFVRDPGAAMEGQAPVLIGSLMIVALWARSAYRSSYDLELENLSKAVTIPFIVVTSVVVLSVYTERSGEVARAGAAYYVVAVLALAMGQLSLSGASFGDVRAGGTVAMLVLGTVGATIGCVVVFWLVFGLIGPIIGPLLGDAIFYTFTIILTPVAWLLNAVFRFVFGLFDLGPVNQITLLTPGEIQGAPEEPGDEPNAVQRGGVFAVRVLMLLFALGILALAVAWFTRLRKRGGQTGLDGEATGIGGAFQDDVRSLFGLLRRRGSEEAAVGTTSMRKLYLEVLEDANARGVEREPDETPAEIAPRLSGTFHAPVTDEITVAFMQSRYAGREPDARTVAELERRWRASRSAG